jgi:Fe-S-cluster containining protein
LAKCLSFHAPYGCRRSGACCSAGWKIPFNAGERAVVHGLSVVRGTIESTPDGAFARSENGRCTFLLGSDNDHACAIHAAGGHAALPLTCRMFPRQVLHDSRGTFISLSHFCPTAAGLLFEDQGTVGILDAPAALAGDGMLDGLDARETWPPLLRPGVMMDIDSFATWERLAIDLLTRGGIAPRAALAAVHDATERLESWTPGAEVSLERAVCDAFGSVVPRPSSAPAAHDSAVKRWLAARLFGSWIAYQGNSLRTLVRYLHACHDVFLVELARDGRPREAIRRSDRLIIHEAASQQIATLLNDRS